MRCRSIFTIALIQAVVVSACGAQQPVVLDTDAAFLKSLASAQQCRPRPTLKISVASVAGGHDTACVLVEAALAQVSQGKAAKFGIQKTEALHATDAAISGFASTGKEIGGSPSGFWIVVLKFDKSAQQIEVRFDRISRGVKVGRATTQGDG